MLNLANTNITYQKKEITIIKNYLITGLVFLYACANGVTNTQSLQFKASNVPMPAAFQPNSNYVNGSVPYQVTDGVGSQAVALSVTPGQSDAINFTINTNDAWPTSSISTPSLTVGSYSMVNGNAGQLLSQISTLQSWFWTQNPMFGSTNLRGLPYYFTAVGDLMVNNDVCSGVTVGLIAYVITRSVAPHPLITVNPAWFILTNVSPSDENYNGSQFAFAGFPNTKASIKCGSTYYSVYSSTTMPDTLQIPNVPALNQFNLTAYAQDSDD